MNALSTTFHELFADNLALCPDKVALVDADRSVSYAALGAEVEAIAARLRALGVTPGARVIVHLRKSIAEAAAGRARLAYEELLSVHILHRRANALAREHRAGVHRAGTREERVIDCRAQPDPCHATIMP